MSKGLEALEKLGNETVAIKDRNTIYMNGSSNNSYTHLTKVSNINKECYETIKQDLDRLERLEKVIEILKQIGLVVLWSPTENENVYSVFFHFEKKQLYTSKDILEELITIFEKNIMY